MGKHKKAKKIVIEILGKERHRTPLITTMAEARDFAKIPYKNNYSLRATVNFFIGFVDKAGNGDVRAFFNKEYNKALTRYLGTKISPAKSRKAQGN